MVGAHGWLDGGTLVERSKHVFSSSEVVHNMRSAGRTLPNATGATTLSLLQETI